MKLPKQYRSRSRSLSPSKDRFGRSYAPRKTDWEKERREEEEREKRRRDDEEKRLEEEKLRRRYLFTAILSSRDAAAPFVF